MNNMKTLQEQYQLIKEGKGQKDVFLREAKRQFPNMVNNAATLEETVKILKNRSVINEHYVDLQPINTIEARAEESWETKYKNFLAEEAKVVEKKVTKEVEEVAESNFDYKDTKNLDNQIGQEVMKGVYFEAKQNPDKTIDEIKEMVSKNLAKDQLYYLKNAAFGIEGLGLEEMKSEEVSGKHKESGYSDKLKSLVKESLMGESYDEFQRDDKGAKGVDKEDKGEEDAFGAGVEKGEEIEKKKVSKKVKKESIDSKLAEIGKQGDIVKLEAQIGLLDEEMATKNERLNMISEDENLSELVDKKKIKDMQKEIKLLEKKKAGLEKMYEKMSGNKYQKEEMVDEVSTLDTEI